MYRRNTTIVNATGLHARPASDFVTMAKGFTANISIKDLTAEDVQANAKSIVSLLTLGLEQNTPVEISAEGEDEQAAVDALVLLIESGFSE